MPGCALAPAWVSVTAIDPATTAVTIPATASDLTRNIDELPRE
jgi:hypothetical protein